MRLLTINDLESNSVMIAPTAQDLWHCGYKGLRDLIIVTHEPEAYMHFECRALVFAVNFQKTLAHKVAAALKSAAELKVIMYVPLIDMVEHAINFDQIIVSDMFVRKNPSASSIKKYLPRYPFDHPTWPMSRTIVPSSIHFFENLPRNIPILNLGGDLEIIDNRALEMFSGLVDEDINNIPKISAEVEDTHFRGYEDIVLKEPRKDDIAGYPSTSFSYKVKHILSKFRISQKQYHKDYDFTSITQQTHAQVDFN